MSWQSGLSADFRLTEEQIRAFERLLDILTAASDRNLTAVTGEEKIVEVHFRDSLSLTAFRELSAAANIVDIGSGAGFPGIPLAIALPEKRFSLIEANGRKCEFIESAVLELGVKNVQVINARAEEAGRTLLRDSFDLGLARAVGSLQLVIEYVMPLLKPSGSALLQRGAREEGDEAAAASAARELGARLDSVTPVEPYPGSKNLNVWTIVKSVPTPERFPRRPGIAKKRPLSGSGHD
ncbi:MAG: 16S rRNA (guanine(527)-N(7))-methyltransferase RsmG [Thermoleophilia bacterium]